MSSNGIKPSGNPIRWQLADNLRPDPSQTALALPGTRVPISDDRRWERHVRQQFCDH
jgi:hypothetical protein